MSDKEEAYFYLPSSVKSKTSIENTISHYVTFLTAPIRMLDGFEYEIALIKVLYPFTASNLYDGKIEYWSYEENGVVFSRITEGIYTDFPGKLLEEFKLALDLDSEYYILTFDNISNKFALSLTSQLGSKITPYINFSKNLQTLTGFSETVKGTKKISSVDSGDSSGGLQNMYCYCNLVDNVNIGDTVAPILAVINYKSSGETQGVFEPSNPIYLPLSIKIIDNIVIEFRTKTGAYFPFTSGEVTAVLHIRPKRFTRI